MLMLLSDLALGWRSLGRSLTFTLAAGLMIAVGIGSTAVMLAVLNAVILRPLPYKDPGQLLVAYGDLPARSRLGTPFSYESFFDISQGGKDVFTGMSAFYTGRMVILGKDDTWEQLTFGAAVPDFFRTVGASFALGRDFIETDIQSEPGAAGETLVRKNHAVILSYEFWRRRYGSDPNVLGRSLDGRPSSRERIAGVLAPGFELLFSPADQVELRPDVWFAYRPRYNNANRNGMGLRVVARLKPEVSVEQASAVVELSASRIRQEFPNYQAGGFRVRLAPLQEALVREVKPTVWALTGSVVFLLLIACANVLNLLLVRSSLRAREMAVRSAIGAGLWPLLRLSLAEALILTSGGAAGGILLAYLGLRQLILIAPASLPRIDIVALDPLVLAATVFVALAAAVVFALAPVLAGLRANVMQVLRGNSRTAGLSGGGAVRDGVVVLEVALCFALLIGSALMLRSFVALQRIHPGFDARGLLTFELMSRPDALPGNRATKARQLEERLRAIPGVARVGAVRQLPLTGGFTGIRWGQQDAVSDPSKLYGADWQTVRPGYFQTMGTKLIDGRDFTEADNDPSRNLVVVDEYLAAKLAPKGSAVGMRFLTRVRSLELEWVEIAGVVEHQRVNSLAEPSREQIYFTDGFLGYGSANRWVLRTTGDPMALTAAARAAVKSVDPKLLFTEVQPMEALVTRAQASTRFALTLITAFTAVAVVLVTVGLYGVLSTVVRQRTPEIGVRMALGATPVSIQRMVVAYALRLSALGVVLGAFAAFGLARFMTAMLVDVTTTDPWTYAAVAILFVWIAALSAWLPARRAAAINPVIALRGE